MIDLKKELQDNEVVVVLLGEDYLKTLIDITQQASKQFEKVCYITLNKPYKNLVEIFKKNGINAKRILFIDALTNLHTKPEKAENCLFVSSPNALTELNIAITKTCEIANLDLLIFDSISTLLIYENENTALRFTHSLIQTVRKHKVKTVLIALESDIQTKLVNDLKMFVDKMVRG